MLNHRRTADIAFGAAIVEAVGLLLWLGSGLTFFLDEWRAIEVADDWSPGALMEPYNQHWSLGLRLAWNGLMATVGMGSYVPYHLVVIGLHVAIAAGIYVYARRQTHPLIALSVGTLFLFLGSGATNLLWGWQMGFDAAAAAGTWALVILLREPAPRHAAIAALLLLFAVATTGMGLFFLAAAAASLVVSRDRWRLWWVAAPASIAFGAWFLVYGRVDRRPIADATDIVDYARDGIAATVGDVTGLTPVVGLVLAVLLGIAVVVNLVRDEPLRLGLVAGSAGLASLWVVIAIARAAGEPESFAAGRFTYVAAIFLLIAFVGWVGGARLGWGRDPARVALGVAIVTAIALAWNLGSLWQAAERWREQATEHRAALAVTLAYGGTPAIAADQGWTYGADNRLVAPGPADRVFLPGRDRLERLIDRYGTPLDDPLAIRGTTVPDARFDDAFAEATRGAVEVATGTSSVAPTTLVVERSADVTLTADGSCATLATDGPDPLVDLIAPAGGKVVLSRDSAGQASIAISVNGTYARPGHAVEMSPGQGVVVTLPDVGRDVDLRVRLRPPAGETRLCVTGRVT